jgi:outer membrane receptor protein involved in Fe transport
MELREFNNEWIVPNWIDGPAGALVADETGSILENVVNQNIVANLTSIELSDGQPSNELREWRWNLFTNYKFADDSPLGGFSVGGGIRYQDDAAIGYPIYKDSVANRFVQDFANPFMGGEEYRFDMVFAHERPVFGDEMDLKLQLNIRNLFDEDDLVPTYALPNGEVATWRIPEPRVMRLSATLSF